MAKNLMKRKTTTHIVTPMSVYYAVYGVLLPKKSNQSDQLSTLIYQFTGNTKKNMLNKTTVINILENLAGGNSMEQIVWLLQQIICEKKQNQTE